MIGNFWWSSFPLLGLTLLFTGLSESALAQWKDGSMPSQLKKTAEAAKSKPKVSTPGATKSSAPAPSATSRNPEVPLKPMNANAPTPQTTNRPSNIPSPSSRSQNFAQTNRPNFRTRQPEKTEAVTRTGKGKIQLHFPQAEIAEVASAISELTQRNFILDDKVRGKVTILSPTPVTVDEAYRAFISALAVKNFTVIKSGQIYKIVPLREMKAQAIPTDVYYTEGGTDAYVTRLIPIKYIKSAEIVKSLKSLVSKNGDLISYDPTNSIIITDSIGNLRRLEKIIGRLDQKGFEESLEVIHLRHAPVRDVADKLKKIFNIQDKKPGTPAAAAAKKGAGEGGSEFIRQVLPDERTNSLIVLANQAGIRKIQDVVLKIDRAMELELTQGKIHVHYLQYADATELSATLSSLTSGTRSSSSRGSSSRGGSQNSIFTRARQNRSQPQTSSAGGGRNVGTLELFGGDVHITADPPTNALVITAAPGDYEALMPIIRKLDIRRPQAFIETMVLEVNIDKAFDLGLATHGGGEFGDTDPSILFGATNFGGTSSLGIPASPDAVPQGLLFGFQGNSIDIPLSDGTSLSIPGYGVQFRALQTNGTINVLATPNILTSDNMEAEIVVGQVVPFITAQGRDINNQPINQINRENVAITLRVTPQINESDDITMDVFLENQDLIPGPDIEVFGPTTSTRSTKTTVLVKSGQSITVGGLIEDRALDSVSKVPILGDIPILGWLFRSKSKTKRKTSLTIFITPHIVREPEELQAITIRKNLERQRFSKQNNVREHKGAEMFKVNEKINAPIRKSVPQTSAPQVPANSPTGGFLNFGEESASLSPPPPAGEVAKQVSESE